jgi:translation initiation factor 3 subunit C
MSRFFRTTADSDSSSSDSDEEELLSSGDDAPAKPTQPQQKQPMSQFLKTAGDSSSGSSSSSDDDGSDDDKPDEPAPVTRPLGSRFLVKGGARPTDSDDSDSEDEKKVVKSAKDKRIEEMQAIGKAIDNALKIGDWVATSNGAFLRRQSGVNTYRWIEFEKLAKSVQRQTNVSEPVPPYWLHAIVTLEKALTSTKEKDPKKKVNASNSRAQNGMKGKIKKAAKENEELIKKYNEVWTVFSYLRSLIFW